MSKASRAADWLWNADGIGAQLARMALAPATAAFSYGVMRRNHRFDTDLERVAADRRLIRAAALPAVSVGNLTVGGSGKTPIAAWCAQQLRKADARPAIVLRGYGDDEWQVHSLLNPRVPVIVAPDRLNGIASAKTQGANCVVLDDAFQHRQAARVADIVLISADQWNGHTRLLPAGPFREPISALLRATAVVITVKAADSARINAVQNAIQQVVPAACIAVTRLATGSLRLATALMATDAEGRLRRGEPKLGELLERSPEWLRGRQIVAVSAIGDPSAFVAQLHELGAVVSPIVFRDHHAFTAADAASIVKRAEGVDAVVCTLKDAVKLGVVWPRAAPPLWYVSQSVVVERGAPALDRALARVLAVRVLSATTAG